MLLVKDISRSDILLQYVSFLFGKTYFRSSRSVAKGRNTTYGPRTLLSLIHYSKRDVAFFTLHRNVEGQRIIWFLFCYKAFSSNEGLSCLILHVTTITGLFIGKDLIIDLDFKVILTDSWFIPRLPSNGERTKINSPSRSNNPRSFRRGKGQLEHPQQLDHSNSMLPRGTYSHRHLDPLPNTDVQPNFARLASTELRVEERDNIFSIMHRS